MLPSINKVDYYYYYYYYFKIINVFSQACLDVIAAYCIKILKVKVCFLRKNGKNIVSLTSAELAKRMVKVKGKMSEYLV